MDNDMNLDADSVASPGGNSWLPLAIGVAALFLGGIALYLSIDGSNRVQSTHSDMTESQQQIELLKDEISGLQEAVTSLKQQNQSYEKQMRSIANQAQTAINQLGTEVASTQRQVTANYDNLGELATAFKKFKLPPNLDAQQNSAEVDVATASSLADATLSSESASRPATHTIAAGDTFGALARNYGVPLNKIIEANPDTDPNRLQIGQVIQIP